MRIGPQKDARHSNPALEMVGFIQVTLSFQDIACTYFNWRFKLTTRGRYISCLSDHYHDLSFTCVLHPIFCANHPPLKNPGGSSLHHSFTGVSARRKGAISPRQTKSSSWNVDLQKMYVSYKKMGSFHCQC